MSDAPPPLPAPGSSKKRKSRRAEQLTLCPYCGETTPMGARCLACRGMLDALSRQASQNAMGPWFVRDEATPFRPGCSFETILAMVRKGKITLDTVMRGPTTHQFWCHASRTPGVSHLLGVCYACESDVQATDGLCDECGADFGPEIDRQHLGLTAIQALPGQSLEAAAKAVSVVPGASESGQRMIPDPVPTGGDTGVPVGDLADAIGVLTRRLRNQTRLVAWLSVAVAVLTLAVAGGAAWWLVGKAASTPTPVTRAPDDADRGGTDEGAALGAEAPSPATNGPGESSNGSAKTPGLKHAPAAPDVAPATPTRASPTPPVVEPDEVDDLIQKDTIESLGKALDVLDRRIADAAGDAKDALVEFRGAVKARRDHLVLKGLP